MRRLLSILSSTRLAAAIIAAIILYLMAASVVPQPMASALGVAPSDLYRHGLLVGLELGLCAALALASATRVAFDWPRAGAWCSHIGVLILAGGAGWYALAGVQGQAVTVRSADGWSDIQSFHVDRTAVLYVWASQAGHRPAEPRPQRLRLELDQPEGSPSQPLNVSVEGLSPGVRGAVVEFCPQARLAWKWRDDAPAVVPAAVLKIRDGLTVQKTVLCGAYTDAASFDAPDYSISYHGSANRRMMDRLTATAPAVGGDVKQDVILLIKGSQTPATVMVIHPDGSRWSAPIKTDKPLEVPLSGERKIELTVTEYLRHARRVAAPLDAERPNDNAATPAVRVALSRGDWRRDVWVAYSPFVGLAGAERVDLPDGGSLFFGLSRQNLPLPQTVSVESAEYQTYGGSFVPKDYRCRLRIGQGAEARTETMGLNHPVYVGGYQLSQNVWLPTPDQPNEIVFGVASRPGLPMIWIGCVMIVLGFPYAFYVKPRLLKRRAA